MKHGFVYIMASRRNGTIYTGVTSDLVRRVYEHRNSLTPGFATKYGCRLLVYYECHDSIRDAITRERQIKKWERVWKIRLIEGINPQWEDLYSLITGETGSPPPRG